MKLQNKKTGEYARLNCIRENEKDWFEVETMKEIYKYNSLAELNAEWEDYEEPKRGWYLNYLGSIIENAFGDDGFRKELESIGNYFETEEEAEQAVEKLKAWKRLKDKGFKFTKWQHDVTNQKYIITMEEKELEEWVVGKKREDLDLLFGGEDE